MHQGCGGHAGNYSSMDMVKDVGMRKSKCCYIWSDVVRDRRSGHVKKKMGVGEREKWKVWTSGKVMEAGEKEKWKGDGMEE